MTQNQSILHSAEPQTKMKLFQGFTLQARLFIAFALLSILPVFVIGSVATLISSQGLRNASFDELKSVAILKENEIRDWLTALQTNLPLAFENQLIKQGVFALLQNNPGQAVSQNQLRNELVGFNKKTGYFVELFVMDRNGSVVLSTDSSQEGKRQTNKDFFQKGLQDQFVSPPTYEVSLNNYSIILSRPIKTTGGNTIGVLAARVNLNTLSDIMKQQTGLGNAGETYLVSSNFAALTELKNTGFELGKTYVRTQGVTDAIKTKTAGVASYTDYAGNLTLGAYQWIPELQVALVAEHLQDSALAASNQVLRVSIILMVITSLIALFIALLITQAITNPITNLVSVANNITQGNFELQAEVKTSDEIGILAQAFNRMTAQLRDFITSLEQRVQERTQALSSVAEVSTATSTILETDKLLQQVVNLAKERFGFYHAHVYLLDETGTSLVLSSGAGEVGQQMVAEGHSIPLDREQSLVARAAREKKGVTVNDVTVAPDFLPNPLLPNTHSELAVPMMVGEEVIGVFDVQSEVVGRFTDADIAVQTTLASQIATSVQNSRSYIKALKAQQLTRSVIDSTDDWIFIKDQNHRYQLVNQGYANSLHIPIADFIGKNDLELGFPEELVKGNPEKGIRGFWADDRSVMDGGIPKQISDDFVTIDGKIHVFDTVKVPLRGADNKVWGVLAFARDMTERRHLEEINRKHAIQQEAINLITQRIQSTTRIEDALQIAARELGHALGMKHTLITLEPTALSGDGREKKEKA